MSREKSHPPRRHGGPMGGPRGMGMPVEKAKDFKGTLKRLIAYLKPQGVKIISVLFLAILSTVFSIVSPYIMGKATTKLADGVIAKFQGAADTTIDFTGIAWILVGLLGLYLASSLFQFLMGYLMSGVSQTSMYQMRNDVKAKLDRLPLKYFDTRTHGEILSRVTNDIENIAGTLQQGLTQLITSLVTLIGILVMMLWISPLMTLIALVMLPISAWVTMLVAKHSQKYFKRQQATLGELNGHVEEMYGGHKIVKAYSKERDSIEKFKKINDEYYASSWRAQFVSGIIQPILNFVNNAGYVVIAVIGGIMVARRAIEVGDIQAFIQYIRQFTQPIVQTANIANIIQSTIASAERVFEVMDEEEEVPEEASPKVLSVPQGRVDFNHVSFRYDEEKPLIEDMDVHIDPGKIVAIVGPTGAGKTTLVNLLLRFYELRSGSICVDGVNIREMSRQDLRKLFGMVLQDTWLFSGTIRDNIAYGREGATEEEIVAAAKAAHADHFIRALPEGYDTVLNEDATNISQGQKQLLTIARAILADPPIMILDEATSNVDTRTEILIQNAMTRLMDGRTNFVIAHRLSTIKNADLILVMNHGTIVERGTHQELLAADGFYANLYNSQFRNKTA